MELYNVDALLSGLIWAIVGFLVLMILIFGLDATVGRWIRKGKKVLPAKCESRETFRLS